MKDSVVLITGASSGIGRETAYAFSAEGAHVVVTCCAGLKEGRAAAARCRELGAASSLLLRLDLRDDASIAGAVDRVKSAYGGIDVLVNNAGVAVWKPLRDQTPADIADQLRTNLEGLIKMTLACLPHVRGTIINIASGAGMRGYAELAPYCASKFGVRGFTQALALEVDRPKLYAVNPAMTKTRMTGFRGMPPEQVAQVVLNAAKGKYRKKSGSDINVWEYYR